MAGFPEKLRLKGMAEEDLFFAKKDRELLAALKQQKESLKRRQELENCTHAAATTGDASRSDPVGKGN